jgi:hypothetical protein
MVKTDDIPNMKALQNLMELQFLCDTLMLPSSSDDQTQHSEIYHSSSTPHSDVAEPATSFLYTSQTRQ